MSKELKDMTNADLAEYCDNEGIDVDSKNVSKPTKEEFLLAIAAFEAEQNENIDDFLKQKDEGNTDGLQEKQETKEVEPKKLTRGQKRRKQYNELMPLRRVKITTNADNQTKTSLVFITWGNGLIGHNTDRVYLNKPWHVREGALRNMENAITTDPVQDDEGNTVRFETKPTYNIIRMNPLTENEIEIIKKRQIIRDASIESLI